VPILDVGDTADGTEVRDLYGIARDSEGLHVTDGYTVFTLQTDGSWRPVALGEINDLGRWQPGPVGAFGGSVYILETEFRNIYRFDTGVTGTAEPHDWVLASVRPDLVRAVDMAIDRNIYVLIDNENSPDEVFLYERGDLKDRFTVPYGMDTTPSSLLIGPATALIYVAMTGEGGDGAVIVFDPVSGEAWQLKIPADFSVSDADVAGPFEGLQDIAIDEDSGTLYLVNDDAVWTAQYQLPVEPEATPAAVATPAS
jgi:DNA-binding beta-propeller fold protein YncE